VLPLSTSILIVIGIVSFVNIWKDYLLPMLVLTDPQNQPVTVRLVYLASRYGINLQMAASFLALLPPLLIAIVLQRYMRVGITFGSIKG
jgi:multiple sugar transport system permease protein